MKAHFFFLLLLVAGLLPLHSQDWAPFVPGQVSYFQVVGSDSLVVRREVLAHYDRGTHTTLYFHDGFSDSCTAAQLKNGPFGIDGWSADSVQVSNNSFIYQSTNYSLTFHHRIAQGQSFMVPYRKTSTAKPPYSDSLRITLDSSGVTQVAGYSDSVKYYNVEVIRNGQPISHPLTGASIVLTQHFGFLRFLSDISFPGYMPNDKLQSLNRISLSNDSIAGSVFVPPYTDWIALQPGDILKWYATTIEPDLSTAGWWYRDSITSIHPEDSIFSYQYDRHRYKIQTGAYYHDSNLTQVFHRKALASNMQSNGNYLYKPYQNSILAFLLLNNGSFVQHDTLVGYTDIDGGLVQSFTLNGECEVTQMVDFGGVTTYHYKLGITYKSISHMYGENVQELVGYRLGGQPTGNTFPLSVPNRADDEPFTLSPNPTSSYFQIDLPASTFQQGQLTLTDLTGRVVLHKQLRGNATVTVGSLPAGLYLVEVRSEDQIWYGKLIKE